MKSKNMHCDSIASFIKKKKKLKEAASLHKV